MYALAASKHAPKSHQTAPKATETGHRKPAPRLTAHKLTTTITLTQKDPNHPVFADQDALKLLVA